MFDALVIVIDHKLGFVGSRVISDTEMLDQTNHTWLMNFLQKEFPNILFDDILIIKGNRIVEEIFLGVRNRLGA